MEKKFSAEYIEAAYEKTLHHEQEILASKVCTCFFCGNQFDPQNVADYDWWDEESPKGKTAVCTNCGIDCIIGDASGFPVNDEDFIQACTLAWFGGYSKLSEGKDFTWPDSDKKYIEL